MKEKLVLIEQDDFKKMEKIKTETGTTVNWQIREAIKQYLKTKKA